jgi:hypothetical protein
MTESDSSPATEPVQTATGIHPLTTATPLPTTTEESDKKDTIPATISFSIPVYNALLAEGKKCGLRTVPDFLRSLVAFAVRQPEGVNLNLTIEDNGSQPELPLGA